MTALLVDTCTFLWWAAGDPHVPESVRARLRDPDVSVFLSAVSAWEIGMLSRPRFGRPNPLVFLPDPKTWFARVLARPGVRLTPLTTDIAIDASSLPEPLHADPGDRLLISTARHARAAIVTRDGKILDYGMAGHVGALAC